jgi:hypothetical protein
MGHVGHRQDRLVGGARRAVNPHIPAVAGPVPAAELDARRRQAAAVEARVGSQVGLVRVTAGEVRWLYARALRRELDEAPFDDSWEPPARDETASRADHRPGVLAHLTDAVLKEGGDGDDRDRPRHRRYVRVEGPSGTSYQAVLAMCDMPHDWTFPGGGGEWLYHCDDVGFPVDWTVRIRSVPNAEAQAKVRRQHRQLIGQVDEYDGETTGAPPSLAEAIHATDAERAELAANPAEPELQVTVLMSIAATTLPELEDRAAALQALFEPHDYGLARPTGGQVALLRSTLPGTAAAAVCRDYTQFLLAGSLASGAPCCGPSVGDPRGLLLGTSIDGGVRAPVLFDPTFGPSVQRTASVGVVGVMGAGKSYMLKRLCWDAIARGGQLVTIDRTTRGEYVEFAAVAPGRAQVVRLSSESGVCLDPLRTFGPAERESVALGFLSLLSGAGSQTEEGAALAEAVHAVARRPDGRLADVVDELAAMGAAATPDPAARSLARRLEHYRRLGAGQLAFGAGAPVRLDADLVVFHAPNLALPDRDTLLSEHLSRQMLPEQVLGHALLYLVAAVGRHVVFRDPARFGAALYDEAWALLASPHGQRLLLEGIRDGRKHNGAIWLASQHPADLGTGELVDLLGSRFVFRQAPGAIGAALEFLGVGDSDDAAAVLERGLGSGQCLYRDVRDRVGLIEVSEPVLSELRDAFDTNPPSSTSTTAPQPRRRDVVHPPVQARTEAATGARPRQVSPETPTELAPGAAVMVLAAEAESVAAENGGAGDRELAPPADLTGARARARARRRTPLATALATGEGR